MAKLRRGDMFAFDGTHILPHAAGLDAPFDTRA